MASRSPVAMRAISASSDVACGGAAAGGDDARQGRLGEIDVHGHLHLDVPCHYRARAPNYVSKVTQVAAGNPLRPIADELMAEVATTSGSAGARRA